MGAWLDLGVVQDFVAGAESDSGYAYEVGCPACRSVHLITLSTLGRYLYRCEGAIVSGAIDKRTIESGHLPRIRKDAAPQN